MRKNVWMKKLLCFILCAVMVLGMVPSVPADAAGTPLLVSSGGKVVDNATLDDWKTVFDADSTRNAGGVWTDKSVFSSVGGFTGATAETESYSPVMVDETNNFLVALSAIASNKSVTGYASIPTDTILVLDMSSSMRNSGSIDDLAAATNSAIKTLIGVNKNNRVGVVLYSGEPSNSGTIYTKVLMPLDHYTPGRNGNYIEYLSNALNGAEGLGIVSGVKNSSGSTVTGKDSYHTGTFTQDGIYIGMQQLLKADTVVKDGIQAGRERMPIMVLMTDGVPYRSSNDYHGTDGTVSNLPFHRSSDDESVDFLTQLTASYAKYKLDQHYKEHDMLFYTLGLGVGGSIPAINPSQDTSTNSLWTGFLNSNGGRYRANNGDVNITSSPADYFAAVKNAATANRYRYYVDQYFQASVGSDLNAAFQAIVDEIILQSKYYPTHVADGTNINEGGYLAVVDTLGEYMEVKDIINIQLDGEPFYGRNAARELSSISGAHSVIQSELLEAMMRRMNISQATALEIIEAAKAGGMLYYNNDSDFNNSVGWYGNYTSNTTESEYKGVWNGDANATAPADANCTIQSYYFYGMGQGSTKVGDMRYIEVEVINFFAGEFDGQTKVRMRMPASLIPLVEYEVELDGETVDSNVTSFNYNGDTVTPIRLIYEVGLKDEITSLNISETAPNAYNATTGTYDFYTNKWDHSGNLEIGVTPPRTVGNSYSYFNPSLRNEFAYYQYDEEIYVEDGNGGYTLYSGAKPSGTTTKFYAQRLLYTKPAAGGTTVPQPMYLQIEPTDLVSAYQQTGSSTWYIPAGTPTLMHAAKLINYKTPAGGNTGTYQTYNTQYVNHTTTTGEEAFDYYVETALGNNGKFVVRAATGIRLQKIVHANSGITSNAPYTFTIAPAASNSNTLTGTYNLYRVAALDNDGNMQATADGTVTAANNSITVTVPANHTAYITGLPAGEYIVTEATNENYIVSDINGTATNANNATVNVETGKLADAKFTNIARTKGNLVIAKEINHPLGVNYAVPDSMTFEMQVALELDGAPLKEKTYVAKQAKDSGVTSVTTGQDGKFTIELKHKDQFEIYGLPYGTVATVVENTARLTDGFDKTPLYYENGAAGDGVIAIASDTTQAVLVVNQYTPAVVNNPIISLLVNKTLTGRNWETGDSFDFELQKWNGTDWQTVKLAADTKGGIKTLTDADTTKQLDFTAEIKSETYSAIGTYYYRVVEKIPAIENMLSGVSYDVAIHGFTVTVTDMDMDGKLEVSGVVKSNSTPDGNITVSGDATAGYTVIAEFENTFRNDEAEAAVEIHKLVSNASGSSHATADGFTFTIQQVDADKVAVQGAVAVVTDATTLTGTARKALHYAYSLAELPTGDTKVFHYEISEVAGSEAGWEYSTEKQYVTVVLSRDTQDHLVATAYNGIVTDFTGLTGASTATVSFTNTYTPAIAAVELDVSKVLTGKDMAAGEFAFELTPIDATSQVLDKDGNVVSGNKLTAKNAAAANGTAGKVSFPTMYFNKVGIFSYNVAETSAGDENIHYDRNIYQVIVRVTDGCTISGHSHQAGTLCATYEVINNADDAIVFSNTYTPNPVDATINVNKTLTYTNGGTSAAFSQGLFNVGLYETTDTAFANPLQVATFGASNGTNPGVARFNLNYTAADVGPHKYVVREIPRAGEANGMEYDLTAHTVTVTVNRNNSTGALSTTVDYGTTGNAAPVVANKYTATPATVQFSGTKQLNDAKFTSSSVKEFTFALYETDASFTVAQGATPIATDVVTVTRESEGVYKGGYSFAGIPQLTYNTFGAHYYVVKEIVPSNANPLMTYDNNEYHITVDVTDNGRGTLNTATIIRNIALNTNVQPNELNFSNERFHPADITVVMGIDKTVKGGTQLTKAGYEFVLDQYTDSTYSTKAANGTSVLTSDENGKATVNKTFAEADAGKTFYFELRENAGTDENMVYDESVYRFSVKVDLGTNRALSATVTPANDYGDKFAATATAEAADSSEIPRTATASFTNIYVKPTKVEFEVNKTVEGESQDTQGYKFILNEYSDDTYAEGKKVNTDILTTDDLGKALISKTYKDVDAGKTFWFELVEENTGKENVTYDESVYRFAVKVDFDTEGQLKITVTPAEEYGEKLAVTSDPAVKVSASFTNIYVKPVDVEFEVNKTVEGESQEPQGYKFILNEYSDDTYAEGKKVNTDILTTDDLGKALISKTYKDVDAGKTFWFELVEENTGKADIVYDKAAYKFSVKVDFDTEGQLEITVTPAEEYGDKLAVAPLKVIAEFTNIHTKPLVIDIDKHVENKGNVELGPQGFKFVIVETDISWNKLDGGFTQTITTNSVGSAVFDSISLKDGESRYFKVYEIEQDKEHLICDTTIYRLQVMRVGEVIDVISNVGATQVGNSLSLKFKNIYDYSEEEETPPPPSTPDTSDSSMANTWMTMIATGTIGFVASAFVLIYRRRKRHE